MKQALSNPGNHRLKRRFPRRANGFRWRVLDTIEIMGKTGVISSHRRRRINQARAVTLIELLVVVAIISLLASILLPSLSTARKQARRMCCASHIRASGMALQLAKSETQKYPVRDLPPAAVPGYAHLANITEAIATRLVNGSLGRPDALYCPESLRTDSHARGPYVMTRQGTTYIHHWKTGQISYIYLAGVVNSFPDTDGRDTFRPELEEPNNKRKRRAVLIGDRTVELAPGRRNIPGSNHGREGGWFFYTTGDALWSNWDDLAAHPTVIYDWYWPRTARP